MWLRTFGIIFVVCLIIIGCLKNYEYHDVLVTSIIQPDDTVISCYPFKPIIKVVYTGSRARSVVCTLSARIWRYSIKMDSFCSISTDTTQSILVYDTFAVVSIKPGINIESLPAWHPIWSDIYWVGQHHKIKVTAHIVKDWIHLKNVLTDDFIVEARNYDLQVNYVGLLAGNVAVPDDTISVGVSYNPVSAVSNSPSGPTAMFRSWFKITRVRTGVTVYSRYLDRTLAAGQDTCLYYQSGYVPSDSGWYRCRSYIEFRPGVDSIPDNNYMDRYFYAKLTNSDASATRTLKAIEVTYQRPLR